MQAPICEVCLKSDMLCSACQEKLETNKITQTEIDISRFIYALSSKVKSLQEVTVEKIIESNSIIIIAKKGDAAKLVGRGGSVVKALAKEFKKSVKIIEQNENFKEFMQGIVSPAVIQAINIVYTPNGELYRIRIPSSQKNNIPVKNEELAEIAENMFGKKAEIVLEN